MKARGCVLPGEQWKPVWRLACPKGVCHGFGELLSLLLGTLVYLQTELVGQSMSCGPQA